MTTYDILWRFMSTEQRGRKLSENVEKYRKISWSLSCTPLCAQCHGALKLPTSQSCAHATHCDSPGEVGKLQGVSPRSARPFRGAHSACACQAARSSVHEIGHHSSELAVRFAKEKGMPCRTRICTLWSWSSSRIVVTFVFGRPLPAIPFCFSPNKESSGSSRGCKSQGGKGSLCCTQKRVSRTARIGEHSGDHNHQDFPKSTAIQMGGVLQYKGEAYCDTNGGVLTVFPFPQSVGAPKALQYKLEAYCNTNGRRIAILFWKVVVVGVYDILLKNDVKLRHPLGAPALGVADWSTLRRKRKRPLT